MSQAKSSSKPIWVVGDSHAGFYENFDYCNNWNAGAFLAYKLIEKPEFARAIRTMAPVGVILLFVFGEIDCRVHLKTHNNVDEVAKRYLQFVQQFKDDYSLAVIGPVASTRMDSPRITSIEFPIVGSCFERNAITRELTTKIRKECEGHNVFFDSILEQLIDEHGLTKAEYYAEDKVHLSNKAVPLVEPVLQELLNANDSSAT